MGITKVIQFNGSATLSTQIIGWTKAHYSWEWVNIWTHPCLIWTHTDYYKIPHGSAVCTAPWIEQMKQMSAKSGESFCAFSSEPGSPQIEANQTEPLGRCRPSRLHAQLLMREDDFVFQDAKRHFLFLPFFLGLRLLFLKYPARDGLLFNGILDRLPEALWRFSVPELNRKKSKNPRWLKMSLLTTFFMFKFVCEWF